MSKSIIEFFTPCQILEKYPDLKYKLNWGSREIGILLKIKLLDGYYNRMNRKAYINETSLIELVNYANRLIESKKVILSNNKK